MNDGTIAVDFVKSFMCKPCIINVVSILIETELLSKKSSKLDSVFLVEPENTLPNMELKLQTKQLSFLMISHRQLDYRQIGHL